MLRTGVAVAAGAWIAPAVLLSEPAQAQATPTALNGTLSGVVGRCSSQNPLNTGEQYTIIAVDQSTSDIFDADTPVGPGIGSYLISLPPGTYDVFIGPSDESFPADEIFGIVITANTTTFLSHGYIGPGC